ncbi:MFS transporter [Alienimonas chondri]|uniref:Nucleoside transporter YegT n=1 Tax=Alienimonas chondri TaxID=2681879 RepID=A0ABX1VCD5_9PLAN|nr:MFS transporter [Alienimonas chondri]NNJ25590.1 putative nucleoside transporter YegT [Alienimonas chondri]
MAAANGSSSSTASPSGAPPAPIGRLAAMMFLQFFIWGSWYVSTGRFLDEGVGWGSIIWWAYSVGPIAALLSPLFLGIVADRFFASERVLAVLMLVGAGAMAAVPLVCEPISLVPYQEAITETKQELKALDEADAPADSPERIRLEAELEDREAALAVPQETNQSDTGGQTVYIALLLAHMLCFMPTLGLTNTIAFSHLTDPERQFPTVRVLGTIGWIAANLVVGFWEAIFGKEGLGGSNLELSIDQYWVTAAACIGLAIYALALPHTPPPMKGQPAKASDLLGLGAIGMMKDRSFAVFMIASALLCVPLAGYYNWAGTFAGQTAFGENATAVMSAGQGSEILFMLLMPLAFARLGVKWMLAAGMAAWALRYALFSGGSAFAAGAEGMDGGTLATMFTPAGMAIFLGILLHGICYDFFFVTGQIYTEKRAPAGLRGQAQGFLVLMTQGVGLFVGAFLFGKLVEFYSTDAGRDWTTIWLWPCGVAAVILVLFCLLFRDRLTPVQQAELAADTTGDEPTEPGPGTGGTPAEGLG